MAAKMYSLASCGTLSNIHLARIPLNQNDIDSDALLRHRHHIRTRSRSDMDAATVYIHDIALGIGECSPYLLFSIAPIFRPHSLRTYLLNRSSPLPFFPLEPILVPAGLHCDHRLYVPALTSWENPTSQSLRSSSAFHTKWSDAVCDRYILYPEALKIVTAFVIGGAYIIFLTGIVLGSC